MYLIDTNVISEVRKGGKADKGVRQFFARITDRQEEVFLSVVTIGELRRGIELIRYRGNERQAQLLEEWLTSLLGGYSDNILNIDAEIAQIWGKLRVPHPENALDKQIAATALIHNLTLVTRNQKDYENTGIKLFNPFED